MENLTHSLSKKSFSGNGFGMASHKSVYDDVFGGPPKFGVPTLAPRFEDYSEIFGGFHSSRGSSIPILDLPVVEEVELAFDVRNSRLDYSEVFGDFDGLDFAVSFEDLVRKSNGGDDSSDDAWSPAQSEALSDERDPSACSERSQSLLNADAHHLFGDARQFNVSYHKVNQKATEKVSNRAAHIAQVHAIPGHAYLINETHASPIIEAEGPPLQASGDLKSNTEFVGRTVEERCFKKSISLPTNSGFRAPGSDPHLVGSSGSTFTQKKPFVTVNDISLRTRPSRLPPPSRPPPIFAVEKGEPEKPNSKLRASNSYAFERMAGESSPPFYDVEIDASSSKVASVAMKVAMEKAQAKIRSAKESMEKKEVLKSRLKLQAQDSIKIAEEKINKTFNGDNNCKDDKVQDMFASGGSGMQSIVHERQNVIKMTQEASDLLDGEKYIDLVEEPTNRRHGKESSSQVSHKPQGTFAWKQETEYFEVVETDISLEAVEQDKDDENNVLQNKRSEEYRPGIKATTGASQQQEVIKEVKASKEAPKLEEKRNQPEMRKDTGEWGDNGGRLNRPMESSFQKENHKNVKVDVTSYESEMSKKKIKKSKQQLQKDADKNVEKFAAVEQNVAEVEVKDNPNGSSERTDSYEVIIDVHAKKANERRPRKCIATEECDENLEEAVERVEDVKWEIQHEERKKQEECNEKEENKKKQKEVCQGKKNESIPKEATEQEDYEKRLNVAIDHDESENNLKRTCEQEDKERHQKPDCETEEKKEMVLETHKLVENEQLYEVVGETGELDARLTEVWKQEPGKHGTAVAFEDEDTEQNSRLTSALKGSMDMSQYAIKHEELTEQTEDADQIKWDGDDEMVNLDRGIHDPTDGGNISSFDGACKLNDKMHETPETTRAPISCGEDQKLKTTFKDDEQELDIRTSKLLGEEISVSFGKNQNNLQHEMDKIWIEDDTKLPYMHELVKDSNGVGIGIGNSANKRDKKISQMACDPEKMRVNTHEKGQSGKVTNGVQVTSSEESTKEKSTMHQVFTEQTENGKKIGAGLSTVLDDKKNTLNTHQRGTSQNTEPKQRNVNVTLAPEVRKIEERLHQERELEKEQLRKLEEEREREREREKDRMAVDRPALEARERSYAEARERAERTAIGRSTADVRQRATVEARGRLDKESVEARLRAERAAVERATAEARQRAFEKAMADKASFGARERVERSVSDKFYMSSRNAEMRQSSSSSDLPDLQSQSAGTSNVLCYSYSSTNAGVESESPQRSKARLERYRRTAERAAKALAEKNMRDLLAQREQAERSRLAETLDAEVRRWSSGKEGNLRALLSTLQYILGPDSGWQPVPLTEVITSVAVKKAYRKATLCVHPDKLQQRGASIQQKYICEKVFDLLKEAWNTFNSEER